MFVDKCIPIIGRTCKEFLMRNVSAREVKKRRGEKRLLGWSGFYWAAIFGIYRFSPRRLLEASSFMPIWLWHNKQRQSFCFPIDFRRWLQLKVIEWAVESFRLRKLARLYFLHIFINVDRYLLIFNPINVCDNGIIKIDEAFFVSSGACETPLHSFGLGENFLQINKSQNLIFGEAFIIFLIIIEIKWQRAGWGKSSNGERCIEPIKRWGLGLETV